jgi:hypothetical protein
VNRALGACLSALALAVLLGGCGDGGLRTERPPHLQTSAVIWECAQTAVVRPRTLTLACADDGLGLTGLRWTGWGAEQARASGRIVDNPCVPSCVASRQVEYPVRVTVSNLVIGAHHAAYAWVRIRATGPHPPHTPQAVSQSLETSGPKGRS